MVEDHLLGLACNLVLLEVLDIPDPVGIDLRLVVVEPGWVDHCSATMLNIDVVDTSSALIVLMLLMIDDAPGR